MLVSYYAVIFSGIPCWRCMETSVVSCTAEGYTQCYSHDQGGGKNNLDTVSGFRSLQTYDWFPFWYYWQFYDCQDICKLEKWKITNPHVHTVFSWVRWCLHTGGGGEWFEQFFNFFSILVNAVTGWIPCSEVISMKDWELYMKPEPVTVSDDLISDGVLLFGVCVKLRVSDVSQYYFHQHWIYKNGDLNEKVSLLVEHGILCTEQHQFSP